MGRIRKVREGVKSGIKKTRSRVAKTVRPNFWKKVGWAFHPKKYQELADNKISKSLNYILALLFASFIIMCILALPTLVSMPKYIEGELSKFEVLNISIESEMSSAVKIGGPDPQIIIDTTGETEELNTAKLLITENSFFYKPYGKTRESNITALQDITKIKESASNFLTVMAILLIPTILITAYVMFFIKYAVSILIMAVLLFIMTRLLKKDLSFKKAIVTSAYAATPMILLEVILLPYSSKYIIPFFQFFGMNFYLIPVLIYLALAFSASFFAMKENKKLKPEEEYPLWDE